VKVKFLSIGFLGGLSGGLLGIGGGIVMVPLLTEWMKFSQKNAHGTALLAQVALATMGSILYYYLSHPSLSVVLILFMGSLVGVYLGSFIIHRISNKQLTFLFSLVLLVAGIRMLFF